MSKAKKQKNANKHWALSAQQTIPYIAMHPDGICQIPGGLYTKTLEYEDINYAHRKLLQSRYQQMVPVSQR